MGKNLTKPDPIEFGFTSFAQLIGKRDPIVGETDLPFLIFRNELATSLNSMTAYEAVIAENLISIEWELFQHRRMRDATLRSMTVTAIRDAVVSREQRAWYWKVDRDREAWIAAKKEKDDLKDEGTDTKAAEGAVNDRSDKKEAETAEALFEKWVGRKQDAQVDEQEEKFEHEEFDEEAAADLGEDLAHRIVDPDPDVQSRAEEELIELGLSAVELMSEAYRSGRANVCHHEEKIQDLERRRRPVKADFDALQKARPLDVEVIEG